VNIYRLNDRVKIKQAPGYSGYDHYTGVVKEIRYEKNTPIYMVYIDEGYDLPFHKVEVTEDNILGFDRLTLH
jgi:hypothetical protein